VRREYEMDWSVALGEAREIRLAQGVIRYREVDCGEPILSVHGILTDGDLGTVGPGRTQGLEAPEKGCS
jgi:hypothetical protein